MAFKKNKGGLDNNKQKYDIANRKLINCCLKYFLSDCRKYLKNRENCYMCHPVYDDYYSVIVHLRFDRNWWKKAAAIFNYTLKRTIIFYCVLSSYDKAKKCKWNLESRKTFETLLFFEWFRKREKFELLWIILDAYFENYKWWFYFDCGILYKIFWKLRSGFGNCIKYFGNFVTVLARSKSLLKSSESFSFMNKLLRQLMRVNNSSNSFVS